MIYTREDALRAIMRERARRAVAVALRDGRLVRPATCSACGRVGRPQERGRAEIQAHHANGYDEAHALDVVFLCQRCHDAAHSADGTHGRRGKAILESNRGVGLDYHGRRALRAEVRAELRAAERARKEAA